MDPKFTLTHDDFIKAATRLGCSVDAIKDVSIVETNGGGFNPDGSPKTLFEGHYFSRLTNHQYDEAYPTISYPKWTREFYGHNAQAEQTRLELAKGLDEEAALRSASWGMYQIMGDNFKLCGFEDVQSFVNAMCEGAGPQLDAFVNYVISRHLDNELRDLHWSDFARAYNGPGQVEMYAGKLDTNYNKLLNDPNSDPDDAVNKTA
jgi:N-acetylmuramidase